MVTGKVEPDHEFVPCTWVQCVISVSDLKRRFGVDLDYMPMKSFKDDGLTWQDRLYKHFKDQGLVINDYPRGVPRQYLKYRVLPWPRYDWSDEHLQDLKTKALVTARSKFIPLEDWLQDTSYSTWDRKKEAYVHYPWGYKRRRFYVSEEIN